MRVLFHQHLFDDSPKEYTVEGNTFGEIIEKTGIKGHVIIYDWGDRLEYPDCHDLQPKSQTIRIIRIPENKKALPVIGIVGVVAGAVLSFFGMPMIGAALVMAGTSMLSASFIKAPKVANMQDLPEYVDGYTLYDGNNPSAIGHTPPVVIGEHKILPPVVGTAISRIQPGSITYGRMRTSSGSGLPSILGKQIDDSGGFSSTQHVKFMYCLGYITGDTLVTDIKLGGNLFCSNREGIRNGSLVIDGNFRGTAELKQNGTLPSMYQTSIKETQLNSEIKVRSEEYDKAFFTTQPNTIGINIGIYLNGFYKQNDDGSIGWADAGFTVLYRAAGTTNWNTLGGTTIYGNRNQLWRNPYHYDIPARDIPLALFAISLAGIS